MDHRTILAKIVTLIYRTRLVDLLNYDDLIKTSLDNLKFDTPETSINHNPLKQLRDICVQLLEEKEPIELELLNQHLSIALENDQKLLTIINDSVSNKHDDTTNKRLIANLVKTLNNYYREQLAIEVLSKAAYDFKFNRNKIGNFTEYLQTTVAQLEPLLTSVTSIKDPALVNEVDFENSESIDAVFEEVRSLNSGSGVYKLGWQAVNVMTQGGFRRGESVGIEALQHKYKTGSSLSFFIQMALHNKPIVTKEEVEKNKKPLLLRVSFEDSLSNNIQFTYQYLKAVSNEPFHVKDFADLSVKEMSAYIKEKLTATGFSIKMLRYDPNQWTYMNLFNKVIELEAQGYAVHLLMVDYLLKLPTTGCIQGPTGVDKRDMVRRVRNFCSHRNILFVSPFQLSTEANQLLRNGVQDKDFLNEVAEKNYTDGCKTLGQELDLELYVHVFNHKRKKYLAFRRGKHRIPTVISEDDKFRMYKFPGVNVPVTCDLDGEDKSFVVMPKDYDDGSDNMLSEILG